MFELMLAKAIEEEAKLSQELIKEGFSHAFKAGELIQEVKNMLNSEEALWKCVEGKCSEVGETIKVEATAKQ